MEKVTALLLSAMLMFSAPAQTATDLSVQPGKDTLPVISISAGEQVHAAVKTITSVRANPSSYGKVLGNAAAGTSVRILDTRAVLGTTWAQIDTGSTVGWVNLDALDLNAPCHDVTLPSVARLLTSPNSNSKMLVLLKKGETLTVIRMEYVANVPWLYVHSDSRDMNGWIYGANLNLDNVTPLEPTPEPTEATTSTTIATMSSATSYSRMGVIINSQLNIRTGPGVNYDRIGTYCYGDRIGIYETNSGWGRTSRGWVSLNYVYLDGNIGANPTAGTVTTPNLHIRTGPGTGYAVVGELHLGERVAVLEQLQLGYTLWGYTRQGWVCMDYIQPDVLPDSSPSLYGTGYVNTARLNVRTGPGTNYPAVSAFALGDVVTILETTTVNGVSWGRTSVGWVCMKYITLVQIYDPTVPTEPTDPTDPSTEESQPTDPEVTDPEETEPEETNPDAVDPVPTEPETSEQDPTPDPTPDRTPDSPVPDRTPDSPVPDRTPPSRPSDIPPEKEDPPVPPEE